MTEEIDRILELPWVKSYAHVVLKERGLDQIVADTSYSFSKANDGFIRENWSQVTQYTLLDPFRMGVLLDLMEEIVDQPGDIVECGCYRGGTAFLLGRWLKAQGRKKTIHLFDSFEGLPEIDRSTDKGYRQGEFKSSFDELQTNIEAFGLADMFVTHKGWFSDTVPAYVETSPQVAMLHIDCDLYTSTMDCFPSLRDRVVPGGSVIFDDYNDGGGGEKRAFKEANNAPRRVVVGPAPQVFYINGQDPDTATAVKDGEIYYDLAPLLENASYLRWLEKATGLDYKATCEETLFAA